MSPLTEPVEVPDSTSSFSLAFAFISHTLQKSKEYEQLWGRREFGRLKVSVCILSRTTPNGEGFLNTYSVAFQYYALRLHTYVHTENSMSLNNTKPKL